MRIGQVRKPFPSRSRRPHHTLRLVTLDYMMVQERPEPLPLFDVVDERDGRDAECRGERA